MGIVITKQPGENVKNAYNNCVLEFTSDSGDVTKIARAVVKVMRQGLVNSADIFTLELTPIAGKFYVNLKDVVTTIVNQNRFNDSINITTPSVILYTDNDLFHELKIEIVIKRDLGITEQTELYYNFLLSAKQIYRTDFAKSDNLFFLTKSSDNIPKVTLFDGFPFDLSIYSSARREVTIRNIRTGTTFDINLVKGVNRLFFSNGQLETCGLNCILPLNDGINELQFEFDEEIVRLDVTKKEADCGLYVKFFNKDGAWSYWRLKKQHSENTKTKALDLINNDFENIDTATSKDFLTGKEATREIIASTGRMTKHELEVVADLFSSPKVYLYNSEHFQHYDLDKWIEINVQAGTSETKNTRNHFHELNVKIDLPQEYTQTYGS